MTHNKKQKDLNKLKLTRKSAIRFKKNQKLHSKRAYRRACNTQLKIINEMDESNGNLHNIPFKSLPKLKHTSIKSNLKQNVFNQLVHTFKYNTKSETENSIENAGFKRIEASEISKAIKSNNCEEITTRQLRMLSLSILN